MDTCFLFYHQWDDQQCLSLVLDENAEIKFPLMLRTFEEIKTLQMHTNTQVILPTSTVTILELELPWLGETKARNAIPYGLEEQLAQNLSSLHFAFDKEHHQHHRYLVVVIDKLFFQTINSKLQSLKLKSDVITIDWFALNEKEAFIVDADLIVSSESFKGSLSGDLVPYFLKTPPEDLTIYAFKDSAINAQSTRTMEEPSYIFIAQRLLKNKPINLSQGDFLNKNSEKKYKFWYQLSLCFGVLILITSISLNGWYLHLLNSKLSQVNEKIAVIYRHFFPNSSRVISPKFRIGQLLKENKKNVETVVFFTLLDKFSNVFDSKKINLKRMHFQKPNLTLTLSCENFAILEEFEKALQQQQIKVTQSQASTKEKEVIATLDLSLE